MIRAPLPNPAAEITSPAQFSTVRGVVPLRGSAAGSDFASFSLQFGQGINPTSWVTIASDRARPVENGVLADWDTSGLDGLYAVRLLVVRTGQRIDTAVLYRRKSLFGLNES